MKIVISNGSGIPIYEQIKTQIKEGILSGEIGEGEMLPSLRTLARELRISVLTTARAYTELEQEGFVTNVQGKGCYVMARGSALVREQLVREVERQLTGALEEAERAEMTLEEVHRLLDVLKEAGHE